ncbi:hypothetical protein [Bacillus mycoides]|uniref:hypothetical protein n=1 Tax=Bacillus mycoides TaxID=1405 RepID=UPI0027361941|nr:hypothetical protein [Bacillus mycoides]
MIEQNCFFIFPARFSITKYSPESRKKVAHILEVSAIFQKYSLEVFGGQQHVHLCMSQPL